MARSSNVDVILRLRNARTFQREVIASGRELEAMGVKGAAAMSSFASKADKLKNVGSRMTTAITLPTIALGYFAGRTAIDFEKSMAQVGVALKIPASGMSELEDLATKMGAETVFSANDAAQAMLELAKSGMTPAQIQGGALATTLSLAAAGGIELADAATQTGSAMNTFGLEAEKAQKIADALAGAANASSANLSDLSLSLQQAGQQAVASGLSLNETVGALAAFADAGIRGSDAGTSLKTFLQRLTPQSQKAKDLMKALGLSFFDAKGEMLSLTGITGQLEDAFRGMTQQERLSAMQTLFGSDATRAANILYNQGEKGLRKYIEATREKGAAEKMAAAQMKGLPGAVERLRGSLETAAQAAGQAAAPAISVFAEVVGDLANAFTGLPPGMQTAIVTILMLGAVIGPVTTALGFMAGGIGRLLIMLPKFINFIAGFRALAAGVGVINALNIALAGFGLTLTGLLAVTGIGAVIAAIVLLDSKFHFLGPTVRWVGNLFKNVFEGIKRIVGDVVGWIADHWRPLAVILGGPIGAAAVLIIDNWETIKTAATDAVEWVIGAFRDIIGFFKGFGEKIGSALSNVWRAVTGPFKDAFEWIVEKIEWALGKVEDIADKLEALNPFADVGRIENFDRPNLYGDLTPKGPRGPSGRVPRRPDPIAIPRRGGDARGRGRPLVVQAVLPDGRVLAETAVDSIDDAAARA